MEKFGNYIRSKRAALQENDKSFSQRQVSLRIGIEPSYLSKIERCLPVALSEEKTIALAEVLGEDSDYLLALGGKISRDVQDIIKKRPMLFSRLVRELKDLPDEAIEASQEFNQVQEKLSQLHDLASIGAFQFSADQDSSHWTRQVTSILRIPNDSPPNFYSLLIALAPEEQKTIKQVTDKALKNNTHFHCELKLGKHTDKPVYILMWGYFEKDDKGERSATFGVIQDITEIVQLRNEIQSAKNSLEINYNEQGIELSTAIEKLKSEISSRKKLEDKLKNINIEITQQANIQTEFFENRAYSLRSLMTRFIAEQSEKNNDHSSSLKLKRISSKINDMGDFFTWKKGLKVEEIAFNLHEALEGVVQEFESDFSQNDLNVSFTKSPDLPTFIKSDKLRIEQICTALLELFITNTPWGYVQFSAAAGGADQGTLVLAITSASKNKTLGENTFYPKTLDQDTPYQSNPTQLVGPMVEAMSGQIQFENPSGMGSLVNIQIPMKSCEPISNEQAITSTEKHALIVEDDKHSQLYIAKVLESQGYEVVRTENGEQALKEAERDQFSIILLDIQLPDMTGIQIAKEIRKDEQSPNSGVPIIAVSAHATQEDRGKYFAAGINGFVSKPFEIKTLMDEIKKFVR
ncbi:response regulator [Maridesulfovibrio frigidus]|uniref:response regulator n=1 Tax=Maridesulfovibrio frigidus TaxID=340956 RepID=UPI000A3FD311|nr:response regulator [Maridesulfovibrio frigidus]